MARSFEGRLAGVVGRLLRTPRNETAASPYPVVARGDVHRMEAELAALGDAHRLLATDRFEVVAARAPRIPALVREIGRLREITFRAAGEGTGRSIDLDAHDATYLHLAVWDRGARELVGAYRLGETERLRPVFGSAGLYTSTLFRYREPFFDRLGPALELGRSFVRPEYQRSSTALLLLWKGIARWVARHPHCRTLFGAVSVSDRYGPVSRALIARFLETRHAAADLAPLAAARRPLRVSRRDRARAAALLAGVASVADLAARIAALEPDAKGVPVLVREYLKLGGRLVRCSVDPGFGDVLDALVVVDLARTDRRLLEFYMGREEAAGFLACHAGRLTAAA